MIKQQALLKLSDFPSLEINLNSDVYLIYVQEIQKVVSEFHGCCCDHPYLERFVVPTRLR